MQEIDVKNCKGYFVLDVSGEGIKRFDVQNLSEGSPLLKWIYDIEPNEEKTIDIAEFGFRFKLLEKNVIYAFKDKQSILSTKVIPTKAPKYYTNYSESINNVFKSNKIVKDILNYGFIYNPNERTVINTPSNELFTFAKIAFTRTDNYHLDLINKYIAIFKKYVLNNTLNTYGSIILSCVPSHEASMNNHSILSYMIQNLVKNPYYRNMLIDGSNLMIRKITVIKSSTNQEPRTLEKQYNSIVVNNIYNIKDKTILLIDDFYTSGYSITACKKRLFEAGAKEVIIFAFGRTVRK